jgi:hypothetical protein
MSNKDKIRIWCYVTDDVDAEIKDMAERESRTPPQMASLLLAQAVKERNRKKKKLIEDVFNRG